MSSRNDYENLFLQHGISRSELCMMTDTEFQKTLQYFLSEPSSNTTTNNYSNSSQYRYISPKLYAQRESQMRRSRREPMIQRERGIDSPYQSSQPTQASYSSYPDYSQYQQYDEDAALQAAIQSSLQEQQSNNQLNDIPNNTNFNQNYVINEQPEYKDETNDQKDTEISSSTYSHVYKPNVKNERVPQTEDQRLFDEQTKEYHRCVEEAFQKEMEENLSKHYEQNQQQIEKEELDRRIGEVVSKYYSLKPEPKTGTTVAVNINNQRYIRKFDPNSKGEDVYAWAAGQTIDEEDEEEKLFLDNFELQIPGIGVLSHEKTLAEQGIKGRVMMNIVML